MRDKDTKILEEAYDEMYDSLEVEKLRNIAGLAYNLFGVPGREGEALKIILKIADPELYKEKFGRR